MYNPSVKMHHWVQDVIQEAERLAAFIKKRENGELLVQQTRRVLKNLFRETRLSKSIDDYVKFGNVIQLKAPDMLNGPITDRPDEEDEDKPTGYGLVLSGTVHVKHMKDISGLANQCQLVGSPILLPCVRNTFIIKSADDCGRDGHNLLFEQDFVLQLADTSSENLYVRARIPLVDDVHGPLGHYPVSLTNRKDRFAIWHVLYCDSSMRFEMEGAPFPPHTRVVLRHVMTGQNLTVEGTVWYIGMCGKECGISAHRYLDSRRRETAECIWMFITDD